VIFPSKESGKDFKYKALTKEMVDSTKYNGRGGGGHMAHDVFISYSSQDKVVADAVCATLESRKIRCWIAPRDVPPGLQYAAALVNAINECQVFVLVLSKGANASGQVLREVETAVDNGTPILPLRIEDFEPTDAMRYYIKSLHWLDAMTPPLERHLGKLADSVQALLSVGEEEQIPPVAETVIDTPGKKRWPLPTWATALLALAVVVIVVGGVWIVGTRLGSAPVGSEGTSAPTEVNTSTEATLPTPIESLTTTIEYTEPKTTFDWHHNPVSDHYYALTEVGMSWDMLEALAVQTGGHLVSINDATEEEWLYSTFGTTEFWIGLTDYPEEGEYRWTTGEPLTYLKWCPGEPTDTAGGAGTEDAAYAIPSSQCWFDEVTWAAEFWDPDNEKTIPSYPGVIEVEADPSPGWSEWRTLSFMFPDPQIWVESGEYSYTAIGQHDADAFAWSTETFEGDLMVSFDLERPESKSDGCVIIYGDGNELSYGNLIFCVDWDGYYLQKHTRYQGDEPLAFIPNNNETDEVYSVTIEIVFSSFFDTEEIDRSGRIGLFKNWSIGEITFSNIQIKTPGDGD
jgi:hypothetical protein